ncbi:MAG: DPP IV N-terminal domain-containing protein [Candidatus Aminicenantes bacterium]|nr:MAG: DPP IV N-terminal domain-containing protein [Candidatus Aminicenantes bacterium]
MKWNRSIVCVLVSLLFLGSCQTRQDTVITAEDYQRAESFLSRNIQDLVYGLEVSPQWIGESRAFWYRINTSEGKRFLIVEPDKKQKAPAFDHEKLARALSEKTEKSYAEGELPFDSFKFVDKDHKKIEFEAEKKIWVVDLETYEISSREKEEREEKQEEASPNGEFVAFAKNHNLFIRSAKTGKVTRLSRTGIRLYEYASGLDWFNLIEGEGGQRSANFRAQWSPDSKKIFTQILDLRTARKMYLLNSVEEGYRAKLYSYYRASPGDENIPYLVPVVFDIARNKEVVVDIPPIPHFVHHNIEWFEDSQRLYAMVFDRGYKSMNIYEINADSGKARIIARDENATCVGTEVSDYKVLPKLGKVLMTSERDGWNHIYLYDWKTAQLDNQVTKGEFVVMDIEHVDEEKGIVYFTAVGREEGEDPYLVHLYLIHLDGSNLQNLTPEHAYHDITLPPDKSFFVDNLSRADLPTKSVLRSLKDGEVVMDLEETDVQDVLDRGWSFPEPFCVKAADGETDIYGLIWRPINFSPSKKYPVIDQCYTGPHGITTPKTFRRALMSSANSLAELGFILVSADGRGTARRSKAFHDFSYRNLGRGCEDHIPAIQQLAEKYPYMDTDRVGIYGHSAGGYDTVRALLQWSDFYKVGVSSAGNHDHRMAKAWWPEQYMGYPVEEFYEEQSNITNAGKLAGKLLLAHGAMDDNVNPASTIRLVDALIKNNKDFDLIIIPPSRHGFRGEYGDYFTRKRWDYFVKHLHGVQPPAYKISPADN